MRRATKPWAARAPRISSFPPSFALYAQASSQRQAAAATLALSSHPCLLRGAWRGRRSLAPRFLLRNHGSPSRLGSPAPPANALKQRNGRGQARVWAEARVREVCEVRAKAETQTEGGPSGGFPHTSRKKPSYSHQKPLWAATKPLGSRVASSRDTGRKTNARRAGGLLCSVRGQARTSTLYMTSRIITNAGRREE